MTHRSVALLWTFKLVLVVNCVHLKLEVLCLWWYMGEHLVPHLQSSTQLLLFCESCFRWGDCFHWLYLSRCHHKSFPAQVWFYFYWVSRTFSSFPACKSRLVSWFSNLLRHCFSSDRCRDIVVSSNAVVLLPYSDALVPLYQWFCSGWSVLLYIKRGKKQ